MPRAVAHCADAVSSEILNPTHVHHGSERSACLCLHHRPQSPSATPSPSPAPLPSLTSRHYPFLPSRPSREAGRRSQQTDGVDPLAFGFSLRSDQAGAIDGTAFIARCYGDIALSAASTGCSSFASPSAMTFATRSPDGRSSGDHDRSLSA